MNFQTLFKKAPMTTLLLISFVGLFAYQVLFAGVDASNPKSDDLIAWGANLLPLTLGNEPWRLLSSGFLHIGLMHLMFNCYAMYYFGQVAEPMLGSAKYLGLFLLSVVGGNILNNYLALDNALTHNISPNIAAGASGGIMGIGMALLIFALFKVRVGGVRLNLRGLLFMMAINLSYGFFVTGIDNAGHIGGAIIGAVLAIAYTLVWKSDKMLRNCIYWTVFLTVLLGFYGVWQDLHQQILPYLI